MSGALNSVLGGSGGGLLSAIGGLVGGAFGGPIGAMIGQAVGNLLQDAIGDAVNGAVNELQEKHGMPKFIGDEIKDASRSTLAGLRDNSVSADLQAAVKSEAGGAFDKFKTNLQGSLVDEVLSQVRRTATGDDDSGEGGWLQAIAKAMGKVLDDKASHLVGLSAEMSKLNKKTGDVETDKANAETFNQKMTEFQATSQEYSMLNNTFSTAIKSLGEALGSMARKQ